MRVTFYQELKFSWLKAKRFLTNQITEDDCNLFTVESREFYLEWIAAAIQCFIIDWSGESGRLTKVKYLLYDYFTLYDRRLLRGD